MEQIKLTSQENLRELKEAVNKAYSMDIDFNSHICIYTCGSLGRLEMTPSSDLDLFFINFNEKEKESVCSNIEKYLFFSNLYEINKNLKYSEPSKQGYYWDFISKSNLLDIGSNIEDYNNSFTARLLLILESKPIYNEELYNKLIVETVDRYFTDYSEHCDDFYPLYLMNDILRYWYTLTLNYEYRRDANDDDNKKNWKRLKLKFARLITCFSMLACLYKNNITKDYVIDCINKTPFERLNNLSKEIVGIEEIIKEIEKEYKWFLSLRNETPDWWGNDSNKNEAWKKADKFHEIVVNKLMGKVSKYNPGLRSKADIY